MNFIKIKSYLLNKQTKETIWSLFSKIISSLSGLILLLFLPRFLGPRDYGEFSLLFSYLFLLQIPFGTFAVNSIKKEVTHFSFGEKSKEFIISLIQLTSFSSLISSILLLSVISLPWFDFVIFKNRGLLIVLATTILVFWTLFTKIFEYAHRLFYNFVAYFSEYFMKIFSILLLFISGSLSLSTTILSFVFGYSISLVISVILLVKSMKSFDFSGLFTVRIDTLKTIVLRSIPLGTAILLGTVMSRIDVFILSFFSNNEIIGYYSVASDVAKKSSMLIIPIVIGAVPVFTKVTDKLKYYQSTLGKIILVATPLCFITFLFAENIVQILFGLDFTESVSILQILSILSLLIVVQSFNQQLLIILNKSRDVLLNSFIALLFNILLSLILIIFSDFRGVAVATVISYCIWIGLDTRTIIKLID